MKIIFEYETYLKEIPISCLECPILHCPLPTCQSNQAMIKKAYLNKRHRKCPLKVIQDKQKGKEL